jgi:glycosyltransferase involved in cell wall biosynthesis
MPYYPELSLSIPPLLDMLEYCEREGVTAIQVSTPGPVGLAGLLIARILNLPCIGFYHTNLPHLVRDLTGDQTLEGLTKKFTAWFYDRMDAVFGSSRQSLDDLAKIGVDPSRLKLAPRGIDLETFHPMWRDESIWRDFGVDGERKLLYVGRMSREKNLDILANGFKQMAPRTRGVRLIMVGDGPYRADLEKTLTGFPVSFTGELHGETLSKVYASSDLFAFPSTFDTFGNVVVEAQASGLPVVVSALGGARESVLPGVTGVVVDGGPNAFAEGMVRLLEDDDLRRRMGQAARLHVEGRGLGQAFEKMWEMYP